MITIPGRIPITIQPLFWLIALFIAFMSTKTLAGILLAMVVILISVLVHEFGHALTGLAFGQNTRIELAAFGGFTYRQGRKLKLWEEFLVVLNGPIAGFCLFLISRFILNTFTIPYASLEFMLKYAALVNLFWTIVNLIPVLPLDGGHLMSIIFEAIFGFRGIKLAIIVGLVIAVGISIFFFAIGRFLIGALFLLLTFESFRSLKYYKLFSEKDRDADLQQQMREADALFQQGNQEEALKKLEAIRSQTKEGILYTVATQEMAEIYYKQKRYEEAYALLKPIEKSIESEKLLLLQQLAFLNKDYAVVVKLANQCFQSNPSYDIAMLNALAYGALSKSEPAVGWLECAVREGLPAVKEVVQKKEFDTIRESEEFKKFLSSQVA